MKKVKNIILIGLIAICFIVPFAWSFFEFLAIKPATMHVAPTLPNDSYWEDNIGMFIGPEYMYDTNTALFYDKVSMKAYNIDDLYLSDTDFIVKNKNNDDVIINAMTKWLQNPNYDENSGINFLTNNGKDSEEDIDYTYIPLYDKSLLKNIGKLDLEYITNLYYYSNHVNTISYHEHLRFSVDTILKRSPKYTDIKYYDKILDSEGLQLKDYLYDLDYKVMYSDKWNEQLLADINSIPQVVKLGGSDELGLLPIPYLCEQISNSTEEEAQPYIDQLAELAPYIYDDIFTDYKRYDYEWWLKWIETYKTDIDSISRFIDYVQKYN